MVIPSHLSGAVSDAMFSILMRVHRSLGMVSRILDALDDFGLVVLAGIGSSSTLS